MKEVEIHFKGQGRDGVVPVGTYLIDAAKRMGVQDLPDCVEAELHTCFFDVEQGFEFLSEISEVEAELLHEAKVSNKARLGCFAKFERPGVIVVMAKERTEDEPKNQKQVDEDEDEKYRQEFTALPLEKKISTLVRLEAIALSETVAYVMNSPFTIADKIGDVLAEFGFKKEEDQKKKKRPESETVNGEPAAKSKPARKVKKPKNGSKPQG